jgi:hypothetical protein
VRPSSPSLSPAATHPSLQATDPEESLRKAKGTAAKRTSRAAAAAVAATGDHSSSVSVSSSASGSVSVSSSVSPAKRSKLKSKLPSQCVGGRVLWSLIPSSFITAIAGPLFFLPQVPTSPLPRSASLSVSFS